MPAQTRASWTFGTLFVTFILGVFMFGPTALPAYKQQLLAYVCALLAGCFGLFFTGTLLLAAQLPIKGKWTLQGGAGFGLFIVVLFWWRSPAALVKVLDDPPDRGELASSAPANPSSGNTSTAAPAVPAERSGRGLDAKIQAQFQPLLRQFSGKAVQITTCPAQEPNSFAASLAEFLDSAGMVTKVASTPKACEANPVRIVAGDNMLLSVLSDLLTQASHQSPQLPGKPPPSGEDADIIIGSVY